MTTPLFLSCVSAQPPKYRSSPALIRVECVKHLRNFMTTVPLQERIQALKPLLYHEIKKFFGKYSKDDKRLTIQFHYDNIVQRHINENAERLIKLGGDKHHYKEVVKAAVSGLKGVPKIGDQASSPISKTVYYCFYEVGFRANDREKLGWTLESDIVQLAINDLEMTIASDIAQELGYIKLDELGAIMCHVTSAYEGELKLKKNPYTIRPHHKLLVTAL